MLECTNYTQTFFKKTFALFAIKNTGNGGADVCAKKNINFGQTAAYAAQLLILLTALAFLFSLLHY